MELLLLLGRLLRSLLGLFGGFLGLLGSLLFLGGGLLLRLLGCLFQCLAKLVGSLDLQKLAGLDKVLELGGKDLLEVVGKLVVRRKVLGNGRDGGSIPILEGEDGGLNHILILGVRSGLRGHLVVVVRVLNGWHR